MNSKALKKPSQPARNMPKNPAGWLVLLGPYGCGKTHLAAAIANYRADNNAPPLIGCSARSDGSFTRNI